MPDSYVTSATIDDQDNIVLYIDVDAFIPGESVEISGHAIQDDGGGFATFSEVQTINTTEPRKTAKLTVKATTAQGKGFVKGKDVTVVLQVSKVWMTVLSEEKPPPTAEVAPQAAHNGWTWGWVKGVGGPDKYSSGTSDTNQAASGTGSTDQTAVGGSSSS